MRNHVMILAVVCAVGAFILGGWLALAEDAKTPESVTMTGKLDCASCNLR
jgi:hypothetical protein